MILLIIFAAFLIAACITVILMVQKRIAYNIPLLWTCMVIIAITFAYCLLAGVEQLDSTNTNERNLATYEELMLYHDVVSNSHDELLRWDYYQKVQKWNADYTNYILHRNSIWNGVWYGYANYDNCDLIVFDLRRE